MALFDEKIFERSLSNESIQKKYARLFQIIKRLRIEGAPRWKAQETYNSIRHLIEIGSLPCQRFGLSSTAEIPETIDRIVFLYLKSAVKAIRMQSVTVELAQQFFDEICDEIVNNPRSLIISWDRLKTNQHELDGLIRRFVGSKKEYI